MYLFNPSATFFIEVCACALNGQAQLKRKTIGFKMQRSHLFGPHKRTERIRKDRIGPADCPVMEYRHSSQIMFMAFLLVCGSVVRCDESTGSVDGGEETDAASLYAKRESMWFGPRLGRNKRTQYDITMTTGGANDNNLLPHDNILDLLRDSNWALIPVTSSDTGDKLLEPSWVSRLGRTEDDEEAMEASRSPPFAPRLGRRRHFVSAPRFAPRLGRTGLQRPTAQH